MHFTRPPPVPVTPAPQRHHPTDPQVSPIKACSCGLSGQEDYIIYDPNKRYSFTSRSLSIGIQFGQRSSPLPCLQTALQPSLRRHPLSFPVHAPQMRRVRSPVLCQPDGQPLLLCVSLAVEGQKEIMPWLVGLLSWIMLRSFASHIPPLIFQAPLLHRQVQVLPLPCHPHLHRAMVSKIKGAIMISSVPS